MRLFLTYFCCFFVHFCFSQTGNSLVLFGNVTRVATQNFDFFYVSLDQVYETLSDLVANNTISAEDIIGGPGATT